MLENIAINWKMVDFYYLAPASVIPNIMEAEQAGISQCTS